MSKRLPRGPEFVRYFPTVLQALRNLGGSARPSEVRTHVARIVGISDEEQAELLPSGQSRFDNRVDWARFYLAKAGLIDASQRGVWTLSEAGRHSDLTHEQALKLFRRIHTGFKPSTESDTYDESKEAVAPDADASAATDHRKIILEILQKLPPDGFERFSQRLLREADFQEVTVTGRSGDGGIDGIGILQVNPLVSFKVLFQCKRYSGSVTASKVRDFRGAMQGRADKGIILTTGYFSPDAKKEAIRDGVPPIELVDGDKLLDMLEKLELGLTPVRAYRVDERFFEEFNTKNAG